MVSKLHQTFIQSIPSDVIWVGPLQAPKVLREKHLPHSISHNQHMGRGEPKMEGPEHHGNHKKGVIAVGRATAVFFASLSFYTISSHCVVNRGIWVEEKSNFLGEIFLLYAPLLLFLRTCFFVWTESRTWGLFLVLPTDSWVTSVTSSLRVFRVPLSEKNFKIFFQPEI